MWRRTIYMLHFQHGQKRLCWKLRICTKLEEAEGMGLADRKKERVPAIHSKDHRQPAPVLKFIMSVIALVNLTFNWLLCRCQKLSLPSFIRSRNCWFTCIHFLNFLRPDDVFNLPIFTIFHSSFGVPCKLLMDAVDVLAVPINRGFCFSIYLLQSVFTQLLCSELLCAINWPPPIIHFVHAGKSYHERLTWGLNFIIL